MEFPSPDPTPAPLCGSPIVLSGTKLKNLFHKSLLYEGETNFLYPRMLIPMEIFTNLMRSFKNCCHPPSFFFGRVIKIFNTILDSTMPGQNCKFLFQSVFNKQFQNLIVIDKVKQKSLKSEIFQILLLFFLKLKAIKFSTASLF